MVKVGEVDITLSQVLGVLVLLKVIITGLFQKVFFALSTISTSIGMIRVMGY